MSSEKSANVVPTAAAIFAELILEADTGRQTKDPMVGRRATLVRLKEACDALDARRRVITAAGVESYLEGQYGKGAGPKAQSIANEKSKQFGLWHYLQAREREQIGIRPRNQRKQIATVIDEVGDAEQRDRLRHLHAESELNARKLRRAQMLFARISPGVDFDRVLASWNAGDGAVALPAVQEVDVQHLKALKAAIGALTDPVVLDRCGLRYDGKRVERKSGTGEALLGLGVVSGLVALHDALSGAGRLDLDAYDGA
ncbi:conserved hypothetical protein [Hyphomicrobiales bacterium]|nr:conserved hypothetical protein [Hyphomicrobiales bacterium]CAH1699848.1 conserved hypothetical protein [Hyphomicrobiales bacterium]